MSIKAEKIFKQDGSYVVEYRGLSNDNKPVDAQSGDVFTELDTGYTYQYDGEGAWNLIATGTGSGGGSELPEVTEEDDGKVLKVVNGTWDKGEAGGGGNNTFFINLYKTRSGQPYIADKSFDDVKKAYDDGKDIKARYFVNPGTDGSFTILTIACVNQQTYDGGLVINGFEFYGIIQIDSSVYVYAYCDLRKNGDPIIKEIWSEE